MNTGRLLARLVVGGLFVGHGTQKLFGWFAGPGIDGTTQTMDAIGMKPGRQNALAAGVSETAGGAMLAAGALTPLAGTALIATMITAIRKVHLRKGVWNTNGGYEFNLVMIASVLALIDGGPGSVSVDRALGTDRTGSGWALAALAAGAAGSTLAIEAARRRVEAEEAAQADSAATAPAGRTSEPVAAAA